jgi:hypothetical protein
MVSSFYLFFIIGKCSFSYQSRKRFKQIVFYLASCLVVMHAYALIIINDRYLPINNLNRHDDESLLSKRATHFLFPPGVLISPPSHSNIYLDFPATKHQSFGRKHHWDAYFGRCR